MAPAEHLEEFLRWRGVRGTPCAKCRGSGAVWYGSGATWRGGVGTAAMTWDICDSCWGSGDADRPWMDLRKQRDEEEKRIEHRAANLFARDCLFGFQTMKPAYRALAEVLEKDSLHRKVPKGVGPSAWDALLWSISKMMRKFGDAE